MEWKRNAEMLLCCVGGVEWVWNIFHIQSNCYGSNRTWTQWNIKIKESAVWLSGLKGFALLLHCCDRCSPAILSSLLCCFSIVQPTLTCESWTNSHFHSLENIIPKFWNSHIQTAKRCRLRQWSLTRFHRVPTRWQSSKNRQLNNGFREKSNVEKKSLFFAAAKMCVYFSESVNCENWKN